MAKPSETDAAHRSGRAELETETLEPARVVLAAGEPTVVGLTLLAHPDASRVGEQARLHEVAVGRAARLSRAEPELRQPGSELGRPLGDPFVSRRPIRIELRGASLVLGLDPGRNDLLVDGRPVSAEAVVSEPDLERGVVLELADRVALLLHRLGMPRRPGPDLGLVGESEAIAVLRAEVLRIAPSDVPVLLRGESGTGKELVAEAIHRQSARRDRPYLRINMAAVPFSTAASELFGHRRGAFTGATAESPGIFGRADGGTLLLDEVGETPADVQAMLLRVLETGEVQPVGGGPGRRVDVRLVAATEASLEEAIAAGAFRLPLYHRLAGWEVHLPPLRERPDDVARLLVHFLRQELVAIGGDRRLDPPADRKEPPFLPASLVARLIRHPWPGNVRQLRNIARLLALSSGAEPCLRLDATTRRALAAPERAGRAAPGERGAGPAEPDRPATAPDEISEACLRETLREVGFRAGLAAVRLGIGRTTIYRLMERYGTFRKVDDVPDDELRRSLEACGWDEAVAAARLEVSERALKLRLRRLRGKPDR